MMRGQGGVLLDTGVLVALLHSDDGRHEAATRWLAGCNAKLHTVEAVLTETAFFLPARQRATVADLAAKGTIDIHCPDAAACKRVGAILDRYGNLDPDWADAMLVWLAEETGIHSIATFDVRDFSTYRIHGRSKFQLEAFP
jgi:predicted nucleic acid-binding protein